MDIIFLASDVQEEKVSLSRMFGLLDKENPVLASYGKKQVEGNPCIELNHLTVYADEKREKKLVYQH